MISGATIRKMTLGVAGLMLVPALASATPSTTYWAPSVATCQPKAVPHVTYDTYYGKKGSFPIDTGLTIGALVALHLAGVIKHAFIDRDNTLARMLGMAKDPATPPDPLPKPQSESAEPGTQMP